MIIFFDIVFCPRFKYFKCNSCIFFFKYQNKNLKRYSHKEQSAFSRSQKLLRGMSANCISIRKETKNCFTTSREIHRHFSISLKNFSLGNRVLYFRIDPIHIERVSFSYTLMVEARVTTTAFSVKFQPPMRAQIT